ncbi:major facilitator superfamily protein [Klebsiella michiganensis]|nr:major facilitator superfamily protein [Klebsiella michiganensis]
MTYMVIAAVIAGFGWQMGYLSTAALGAAGVVLMLLFMRDSPQSCGFPSINVIRDEPLEETEARGSVFKTSCWRCATRPCGRWRWPRRLCISTATR